jgi:hypothetical protein
VANVPSRWNLASVGLPPCKAVGKHLLAFASESPVATLEARSSPRPAILRACLCYLPGKCIQGRILAKTSWAALASLLTALAGYGLVTDSSVA